MIYPIYRFDRGEEYEVGHDKAGDGVNVGRMSGYIFRKERRRNDFT